MSDPVKYALIIAVGNYPAPTGWPTISSLNDVALIKGALLKQGFENKNITLISDSAATKVGIEKAFNELISKVNKGDMVVVHYSGHGQQIFDDNGDEIDGLDEAIVPYGAPAYYYKGYTGDKHMRDDELGILVNELQQKAGKNGQVIVFLDSCHSGTGTRGVAKVRGGVPPLVPPDYQPVIKANTRGQTPKDKGFGLDGKVNKARGTDNDLAPFIVFSAASADELNYECKDDKDNGVGSLSFAISKAFTEIDNNTSFRGLFAKVLSIMAVVAPRQTPMVEGDVDYKIFNGKTVKQDPYLVISEVVSDNEIKVDAGNLSGLFQDDKVALYASGISTIKNQTPVMTGIITSADNYKSVIQLDKPFKIDNIKSFWVFVTQQNFGNKKVSVSIEHFNNKQFEDLLNASLQGLNLVSINGKNPDLIIKEAKTSRGTYAVNIYTAADGYELKSVSVTNDADLTKVSDQIKYYAQSKFIREMKLDDPKHSIIIEVLRATLVNGKYKIIAGDSVKDVIPSFKVGDTILIRVTNVGTDLAYFNILDIQPDGIINPLIPRPNVDGKEYKLEPGKNFILTEKPMKLSPPEGTETFKVFATSQPINFTPILATRGEKKGNGHPLEVLFSNTIQTRGPVDITMDDPGSTFDYTFKILPK